MARSGPLSWTIDGKEVAIANTYYLALPEGLQYTIEYEPPPEVDPTKLDDDEAYDLAFPLMRYAYQHRLHERQKITRVGKGEISASRIGVSIFKRSGIRTQGYRVARSLSDLESRIDAEK